jgi:hypothetical protein
MISCGSSNQVAMFWNQRRRSMLHRTSPIPACEQLIARLSANDMTPVASPESDQFVVQKSSQRNNLLTFEMRDFNQQTALRRKSEGRVKAGKRKSHNTQPSPSQDIAVTTVTIANRSLEDKQSFLCRFRNWRGSSSSELRRKTIASLSQYE